MRSVLFNVESETEVIIAPRSVKEGPKEGREMVDGYSQRAEKPTESKSVQGERVAKRERERDREWEREKEREREREREKEMGSWYLIEQVVRQLDCAT